MKPTEKIINESDKKQGGLEVVLDLMKQGSPAMDALYKAFAGNSNTVIREKEEKMIRNLVLTNAVIDGLMAGGMSEISAVELLSAYTDSVRPEEEKMPSGEERGKLESGAGND